MDFTLLENESTLTIKVNRKFDAILARELQNKLETEARTNNYSKIVFNLEGSNFLASSGLRVMIFAKEGLGRKIDVSVINASETALEVMKMSGINKFITIET